MLHKLTLAHRLLLIYLLSFVAVVVLAYSLVAEKNIAIAFAQKEQRGSAYVAVARDALLSIIDSYLSSTVAPRKVAADLTKHAASVRVAEASYGRDMRTRALAARLATLLIELDSRTAGEANPADDRHAQAISVAKQLILQIVDDSNLILDPDLDSYYMMSIATLRLPDFVSAVVDLSDSALPVLVSVPSDGAWIRYYVTKGAFGAATKALAADNARTLDAYADESSRRILRASFARTQEAIDQFLIALQSMLIMETPVHDGDSAPNVMAQRVIAATAQYWRQVSGELDRLLQERIDRFYRKMAMDLGIAGLVWLAALALILIISRQITRPVRELASVADRIRHDDYGVRARVRAGGEIGILVSGFNAMLDRLQREIASAQERVARERAAAAERQLLQTIPVVISVIRESDGKILYANSDSAQPACLPSGKDGNVMSTLDAMHPADRRALSAAFQLHGKVDGFEARIRVVAGEDYWMLVGSRAVTYQGEAARLDVYTPINDRKKAEAALAWRNAVLDAVTYAATRIITAEDWRTAMPEFLSRLGTATDVHRAFLFEVHPAGQGEGLVQSCRFMWSAAGVRSTIDDADMQDDPIPQSGESQFADWHNRRAQGEVIQVRRRDTYGDGRIIFEQSDTHSMLSVPVLVSGRYWGSLGFDDCQSERLWDEGEIDLLKTAAALIAGAIGRSLADARLWERDCQLIEAQRIAHIGSWVLDFATDQVTWSDEGWRIFGLEPRQTPWSHAEMLARVHPEDRKRVAESDAEARAGRAPEMMEYRIIRPDGEIRVLHERAEVVRDSSGQAIRLVGTVHDVTELKATEARLRESEERYALAARGADVGLWDLHLVADRAYLSPRLHEILGTRDHGGRQSISELLDALLPEDVAALKRYLEERYARQRRRFEFEVRTQEAAGDSRWLVLRGLIVYSDGKPVRLVGSLRDVTDRKRTEEEMVRQREALHQSEKMAMFGSLLAGVAHELNNPLSVVIGQIALLRETVADPAVVQRAERIRSATERCARIVRTFLAMARQQHAEPKPVNLNTVIHMAVELLSYQLRSANIRIDLDLAEDLPTIAADSDQIHQVVANLIVNARQALASVNSERRIKISTRLDGPAECVKVSVSDNGPGVPSELRSRIFDPFFTTKPVGEGSGIGLSLCSSIIRGYGGRIDVSDNGGCGALFTIALPLGVPCARTEKGARPDGSAGRLRVLIIEDEIEIADTLSEILRKEEHETEVAADGQRGLELVRSRDYDLILSDIRMPVLDGRQFYAALRHELPEVADRVAFITGDMLSTEIRQFLTETKAAYLEKPFLPNDVLDLVRRATWRRGISAAGLDAAAKRADELVSGGAS